MKYLDENVDQELYQIDPKNLTINENIVVGKIGGNSFIRPGEMNFGGLTVPVLANVYNLEDGDNMILESIKSESTLLNQLKYGPNIQMFYGICHDVENRKISLVNEILPQNTLHHYVRYGNQYSYYTKYNVAQQIAATISFLHKNDYAHLNLNPINIYVGSHMILKIPLVSHRDFGKGDQYNESDIYIPIEIFNNGNSRDLKLDKKADIYSFGMILYFLCIKREPFNITDFIGSSSEHGFDVSTFIDLDTVEPVSLRSIIANCINSNPDLRPDIDEIIIELEKEEEKNDLVDELFAQKGKVIDTKTFLNHLKNYINQDLISEQIDVIKFFLFYNEDESEVSRSIFNEFCYWYGPIDGNLISNLKLLSQCFSQSKSEEISKIKEIESSAKSVYISVMRDLDSGKFQVRFLTNQNDEPIKIMEIRKLSKVLEVVEQYSKPKGLCYKLSTRAMYGRMGDFTQNL